MASKDHLSQTVADDASERSRVPSRRPRRTSRWFPPAAPAVAVIVVAAAAAVAAWQGSNGTHRKIEGSSQSVTSSSSVPARAVAWTSKAAPWDAPSAPTQPKSPAPAFGACSAAQLSGTAGDIASGAGQWAQYVILTNKSRRACTLSGGPSSVSAIGKSGKLVELTRSYLKPTSNMWNMNLVGPANLAPGQSGQVAISTVAEDYCPASAYAGSGSYTALVVGIGTTGLITVVLPKLPFVATCGVTASAYGIMQPTNVTPPNSPLSVLTARIATPTPFPAGGQADYTVTLSNPTAKAVTLNPCPSYVEYIDGRGAKNAFKTYYLNCGAAQAIPARSAITFEMSVPVPNNPGRTSLDWQLQQTTVLAGALIEITQGN
jgi:hypothetical protein